MSIALGAFIVVVFGLLALQDLGYLYRGHHRGEYVEQSGWSVGRTNFPWKQLENGILLWEGMMTFPVSNLAPQNEVATLTLTPLDSGLSTIPALCPLDESSVRSIVHKEICSTPIFTGLKYGGFGDSDFDRVDSASLCAAAKTWLPGDPE